MFALVEQREQAAQCMRGGLHADLLAVALEDFRFHRRMQPVAPAERHHPDRLGLGAAARSGDAGDRQRDLRAPSAIARATGSLTAPCLSIRSAGTPIISLFAWFEYVTKPRSNQPLLPEMSVIAVATMPPVQDSAVTSIRRSSRRRLLTRIASW
jgi:hypothetical protein